MVLTSGHVYTNGNGASIVPAHTNDEAIKLLSAIRSEFAQSLVSQHRQRGLSDKQWYWVHKILLDTSSAAAKPVINLGTGIQALFDVSALKYPKIYLQVDGLEIRMSRCGAKSRQAYVGSIAITTDEKYGHSTWFGRIMPNGDLVEGASMTQGLRDFLVAMAADPATVLADLGRRNGICCYCGIELKDERSTQAGYGPDCAAHRGLPWGNRRNPA